MSNLPYGYIQNEHGEDAYPITNWYHIDDKPNVATKEYVDNADSEISSSMDSNQASTDSRLSEADSSATLAVSVAKSALGSVNGAVNDVSEIKSQVSDAYSQASQSSSQSSLAIAQASQAVIDANTHADTVGSDTLSKANSHADTVGTNTLNQANAYTDGIKKTTMFPVITNREGNLSPINSYWTMRKLVVNEVQLDSSVGYLDVLLTASSTVYQSADTPWTIASVSGLKGKPNVITGENGLYGTTNDKGNVGNAYIASFSGGTMVLGIDYKVAVSANAMRMLNMRIPLSY